MTRRPQYFLILILLFAAVRSPAQTQQTPETSTTGTISGSVVNESGQPLAGAFVNVEPVGSPDRMQLTMTDRRGAFKVDGLEPGSYLVSASLPAYTQKPREPENAPIPQYTLGDSVTLVLIKGGVITGTVTSANGEPVVGIAVTARLVLSRAGQRVPGASVREAATDDRGVYRIYGLPTGAYIVGTDSTNDHSQTGVNAFSRDVPTYAPASTRDTAEEFTVRTGEEVSNVDIRYRGERGRSISGTVAQTASEESGFAVILTPSTPGGQQWTLQANNQNDRSFVIEGIGDGDYLVTAMSYLTYGDRAVSESKLVNVRGADVTGLEFKPQPLANIEGRIVAEETKAAECTEKSPLLFTEASVSAWHKDDEAGKSRPPFIWSMGAPATPTDKGTFKLRTLAPSQYYFQARVQAKNWYLKSITMGSPTAADVTRVWTNVKSGDLLSGLTVTFAQGAASLSGKLGLAEGQARPEKLFVYLVPAEPERAADPLRFYGAPVMPDGNVALNNLAPGRYWVLPEVVVEETPSPLAKVRVPDATRLRTRLRRDAEAGKTEIELKPCQSVLDFKISLK